LYRDYNLAACYSSSYNLSRSNHQISIPAGECRFFFKEPPHQLPHASSRGLRRFPPLDSLQRLRCFAILSALLLIVVRVINDIFIIIIVIVTIITTFVADTAVTIATLITSDFL
jgi:hypothetical protein